MSRKVYLLTDEDFEGLRREMERDPRHGQAEILNEEDRRKWDSLWRVMNYRVTCWMDAMRRGS